MRKPLLVLLTVLSFNAFSEQVKVSYKCGAPAENTQISAGTDGEILKIKSLVIPSSETPDSFQFIMKVDGITAEKAMNGSKKAIESTLKYGLKEMKTGTLLELKNDEANDYSFDAIFLEFGNIDVMTAGPIPEGTFNQKISVALIKSNIFYQNPNPMTVKKVIFECKTTVKYE